MLNRREFFGKSLRLAAALTATSVLPARAGQRAPAGPSRNFEFAIIGAGLFGSAAARHLSQSSDSVALIGPTEPSRPREHQGVFASHYDASRLTRSIDPDLVWATLAGRSIARYREIERLADTGFFHEIGYMMVTPGGLGTEWFNLPAMREVAADLGIDIEDLDDASLEQRFPYLRFTPGSSAMSQQRDAGYIDPRGLLAAQQKIGVAQGATVIREEVTRLRKDAGQMRIETRSGATIRAGRVLVATGAYTNATNLLRNKLAMRIRAAMIMVSEVAPQARISYPATLYAKTDGEEDFWGLLMPPIRYPDGRTCIKTMDGYYGARPLRGHGELGDWSRGNGHEEHHGVLQRALREVFPSLEVLSTRFQPCLIADTESHYPYIDMLDDRIGIVIGGNGKAAKSSDEIGRLAAHMLRTRGWPSSLPQALFAARFEPAPTTQR